eukprot:GCRY01003567.1.p1 GENE.GCRY01003567.1~~GCRY01003567.1.p1  ORF type:complete len:224 (+),score=38.27 GCRY01003567.1:633-1304(+)
MEHAARIHYETTVGAGLPIIHTLRDLRDTQDSVVKVEAVLSGSLSFLFNTLNTTPSSFSDVVFTAKEKGYMEPDPRDDLNCLDFARKMLIIARECGDLQFNIDDVQVPALLPHELMELPSTEAFLSALPQIDWEWSNRFHAVRQNKKALKLLGCYEKGHAPSIELVEVDASHSLHGLVGAENFATITTTRYTAETPLTIKGPGAGPSVTAGGVLADILRVARG